MATYQGVIFDPYNVSVQRPVQNKGEGVEIETFGFAVPRPVQKVSGYFFEPTKTDGGDGEIKTPRKTPLESTWKRANANVFE